MDAQDSHRGDDSIVSKHPLLVEISNYGSKTKIPTFGLPTELISLIFRQCGSDILSRLTLTHTCQRWRQIALNDASLWTSIYIETRPGHQNTRLDHFISLLGIQLERTGDLLLDVEWYARPGDELFVATLQLLREKAPFSRWRTLTVYVSSGSLDDPPWSSVDTFTNLEFLEVKYGTNDIIIRAIDRAITSRLRVLDLRTWSAVNLGGLATCFAKSLTHISTFRIESISSTGPASFIHDNVTHLRLENAEHHSFPHVRTYEVEYCIFHRFSRVELGNVTTLIIVDTLYIFPTSHIVLPAVRELQLESLLMDVGAKLEAPALDTLHFLWADRLGERVSLSDTNRSLLEPGYLLSPNSSLIVDRHLPASMFTALLNKSPKVTNATLRFDNWTGAQIVLSRLLRFKAEPGSKSAEDEILCPRLSELRLDFHWEYSEPSPSKEWLINALKSRKESGVRTPLSIYVGWKGEGIYMLLMGN